MRGRLDKRQQRGLLFVIGHVAMLGIVIAVLIMPILSFFADRDARIDQKLNVLARLTAMAAQAAPVQSMVSDIKAQVRSGEFYSGSNENVISANIQTQLKTMVESAGARPRAVQALPGKAIGDLRYAGSRIDIYGPLPSIMRALHAIENAKPYLFVRGATLRMQPPARRDMPEEPVMQAELDVFGAIRIGDQP
jgi:hypothetical protein